MEKMAQLFRTIQQVFATKKKIEISTSDGEPVFDKRYKEIVRQSYTPNYLDMLDWVNRNSNNSVEVKFNNTYGHEGIYIGFENADDALLFKIRYST